MELIKNDIKYRRNWEKTLELSTHDRALLIRQLLESLEKGEKEEGAEELWAGESKLRYDLYK